ncbi:UbiX family flavin prenyltransferase [bacterium]|nr:UbiX family flavin prenyltransferase [bacterium]
MKRFIIGISGASGSIYGIRLIEELIKRDYKVYIIITEMGRLIIERELNINLYTGIKDKKEIKKNIFKYLIEKTKIIERDLREKIEYLPIEQMDSPISSGSFITEGMAVVPCSMSTLSGIAQARSINLLERAADVTLKEGRPLLLTPREMPLNALHLENMLKLKRMGVIIAPPMPAFYGNPQNINDLVNFVVGKIMDSLKISNNLFKRWSELN